VHARVGVAVAAGLVLAAQPSVARADAVSVQLDVAHTGVSAQAVGPPLRERWRRTFDSSVPISHEVHWPLVAGGRVFVTFQDRDGGPAQVYALDPQSGSTLWERDLTGWLAGAGYGDGKLVVATSNGVSALDAVTGATAWARTTWPGRDTPSINDGLLVAGGDVYIAVSGLGTAVYALHTADGSIEWQHDVAWGRGLAAGSDRLYVNDTTSVLGLRRSDGGLVWQSPPPPTSSSFNFAAPTLAGGRLYIPARYDGAIYDAASGALLRSRFWMDPLAAVDASRAYVLSGVSASEDAVVQAVSTSSGETAWEFGGWRGVTSFPLVAGDVVYVTGPGGTLYALDKASGAPVWCAKTGTINYASKAHELALGEGLVLLPVGGELVALEPGGTPGCPFYADSVPRYTDPIGGYPTVNLASAARVVAPGGFVANRGQFATSARFVARARSHVLAVGAGGPTLALAPRDELFGGRTSISLRLRGGRPARAVRGERPLPGVVNDFRGSDPARWQRGLRRYQRVRLKGLARGVDMIVREAAGDRFEYDLAVAPGVDPRRLVLDFRGAGKAVLDARGQLVFSTPAGRLVQRPPVAFQRRAGRRLRVPVRFTLSRDGGVGFDVGRYDRKRPLVIDPVLEWATYLGGGMDDWSNAIASDPAGNVYVVGRTGSRDLPALGALDGWDERNAICGESDPCDDAFVAKYGPDGGLVHLSYLSGRENDVAQAVVADSSGNAYVTGSTMSPNFPVRSALQTQWRCGSVYGDAFVAKLSADGTSLDYSTYLGGCGSFGDVGRAIAVDGQGRAVVAGETDAFDFPTTSGAADRTCAQPGGFCRDGFVARVGAAGNTLEWSTLFGGDQSDEIPYAIALDSQERPVIAGETGGWGTSDFPTTPGTYGSDDPTWFSQVFAARLASDGSALEWATSFGGVDWDAAHGLALDAADDLYLAGTTESRDFPTTDGAFDRQCNADSDEYSCTNHPDAFVLELSADGAQLEHSTFLGGAGYEAGTGVALDSSGRAYVTGSSSSPIAFPLVDAFQADVPHDFEWCAARADCSDAFLVRLDPALAQVEYGTFYGGLSHDVASGVTLAGGDAWIAGLTHSPNLVTTGGAPQPGWAGGNCGVLRSPLEFDSCADAFVARIDEAKPPPDTNDGGGTGSGGGTTGGGDTGTSGGDSAAGGPAPAGDPAAGAESPTAAPPAGDPAPGITSGSPEHKIVPRIARKLSMTRSGRRLRGRVVSDAACKRRVPVLLDGRVGRRWRTLGAVRTGAAGWFALTLPRTSHPLRVRAAALDRRVGDHVVHCDRVASRVPSA
jgi:hypothetical protein